MGSSTDDKVVNGAYNAQEEIYHDPTTDNRVCRKLDRHMMPLLFVLCELQSISGLFVAKMYIELNSYPRHACFSGSQQYREC